MARTPRRLYQKCTISRTDQVLDAATQERGVSVVERPDAKGYHSDLHARDTAKDKKSSKWAENQETPGGAKEVSAWNSSEAPLKPNLQVQT